MRIAYDPSPADGLGLVWDLRVVPPGSGDPSIVIDNGDEAMVLSREEARQLAAYLLRAANAPSEECAETGEPPVQKL